MVQMSKIEGYKIPEPIDPESLICFKVYIPDDQLYRAAFWQSFRHLTTWGAWERNEAKTGKDVADVWKAAYDLSRIAYEAGEGCEGMSDVEFRVEDCVLQFYDPCTETWKPVKPEGADPDYDPLVDDPVEVPFPEPDPDPESGTQCLAAANAAAGLKEIIDRLDVAYFEGSIVAWLEVTIVLWALQLVKWISALIANVTQATATYTYEEFHSDYLAFDWDELRDELICFYDENGVMSESNWLELGTRLSVLEPTSLIWLFIKLIVAGVGAVGMTNGANKGIVLSADCAPCGGWEYCWDFSEGNGGWAEREAGEGSYSAGAWRNNLYQRIVIEKTIPETDIYYFEIEYSSSGAWSGFRQVKTSLLLGETGAADPPHVVDEGDNVVSFYSYGISDQRTGDKLQLNLWLSDVMAIHRFCIRGYGENPFD